MENQMIIKMYGVTGMSCQGCVDTVRSALNSLPEVIEARVQQQEPQAIVSMRQELPVEKLRAALAAAGHYDLHEILENEAGDAEKTPRKPSGILRLFRHKKDCCK